MQTKRRPGEVRDAITQSLANAADGATVAEIRRLVVEMIGPVAPSSIRSYLQLNTPSMFQRLGRAKYILREFALSPYQLDLDRPSRQQPPFRYGAATLIHGDSLEWLRHQETNSIHAVVTDPPWQPTR